MGLEPELAAMMQQTVQIAPRSAVDVDRTETYAANVPMSAHVEFSPKMIRVGKRDLISNARAYVGPTPIVLVTARITLPDGTKPKILRVDRNVDELGADHHQVIYV